MPARLHALQGGGDDLSGRVALVTGASSGIGRAIALTLASAGAAVWMAARTADNLAEVAAIGGPGAELRPVPVDLTDDAGLAHLRETIESGSERLDIVVHAAGSIALGATAEAGVSELDAQYRVNLRARYLLTQLVLPLLAASGGDLVFVCSTAALGGRSGVGQYAALQAGVRALADAIRAEVNGQGVRVLTIFPGRTATPMQQQIHRHEGRDYRPERLMQPQDVAAMVLAAVQLPRTAEVTEIVMRPFVAPS
jgi:NADP-dependent 3-hydroxy acid dehydrogenase YdfG